MRRVLLAFGLLVLAPSAASAKPSTVPVPFVGCATDGQLGPQPRPSKPDRTPRLPTAVAVHLAYYSTGEMGVLAPRGWRCLELLGSSGGFLLVTPRPHAAQALIWAEEGVRGPAVQLTYYFGQTSGRFAVAQIGPRYFPEAAKFAGTLAKEQRALMAPPLAPVRRFATDRVVRRGAQGSLL